MNAGKTIQDWDTYAFASMARAQAFQDDVQAMGGTAGDGVSCREDKPYGVRVDRRDDLNERVYQLYRSHYV
jgi:hypothetical protein